jgi:hypothetical protein
MDENLKQAIDLAIDKLIQNRTDFQITSVALIKMMHDDGELQGELDFYWRICEAVLEDDKSLSYDEKEQFLILHKSLVEVYNEAFG